MTILLPLTARIYGKPRTERCNSYHECSVEKTVVNQKKVYPDQLEPTATALARKHFAMISAARVDVLHARLVHKKRNRNLENRKPVLTELRTDLANIFLEQNEAETFSKNTGASQHINPHIAHRKSAFLSPAIEIAAARSHNSGSSKGRPDGTDVEQ